MRHFLILFLSTLLLLPLGSFGQSLGNADFQCEMDSAVIHQSQAKIPCTSLYDLVSLSNPSSEYLKHFPDQYTPIKTINIRLVFFHKDSNRIHNFRADDGVHLAYFRRAIDSANSRLSALLGNADSFKCRSEPDSIEYVDLFGFDPNEVPQVLKWTPDGNALTQTIDSRIRFRIHDAIDIISPSTWQSGSATVYDNHASQNNIPNDALIIIIRGDQHDYDLWNNPSTYDSVTNKWEGGPWSAARPSTTYNQRLYFYTSDVYNKYMAMQTGFFCLTSPNNFQCCVGDSPLGIPDTINGCPDAWHINDIAKGFVHEIGHNMGMGHANQCYSNIQNNDGGSSRKTWYNLQVGQVNRVVKNSNVRTVVNECWPAPIDRPITGNVLFDENQRIYQNLIIKNNAVLTVTCELHMPNVGVIMVEPGGKLIVDGGKITNINNDHCGNKYWRGIEVLGTPGQPQNAANCGILELKNGAVIENASFAVKNYYAPTSTHQQFGGIIRASDSKFLNNSYSVSMENFQNYIATDPPTLVGDISYFIDCEFEVNNDFRPGYSPLSGGFNQFIRLDSVAGVKIKGCEFNNLSTIARDSLNGGVGIYANNASFEVQPKSTAVNAKRTQFKNLHNGIYATGNGSYGMPFIDQCDFIDNENSVVITAINDAQITRNTFTVGLILEEGIPTAITSYNSTGYHIEGNHIKKGLPIGAAEPNFATYGIRVYNSGTASNEVYRNTVTEMEQAMIGQAINRSGSQDQGLEFKCDSMNTNIFDFVVSEDQSIASSIQGIKATQGAAGLSAGNTFDPMGSQAESHYKVAVDNPVDYFGHPGNGRPDTANQTTPSLFSLNGLGQVECESSFEEPGGGNPLDSSNNIESMRTINNSEHAALDTVYANLFYNRSQMVDGGSTPQLLIDIQSSWNEDALNLRNELLENSPLSEDAFMEAANSGILPDALLLEVALANPDATQSMDIIDQLQYEIPNTLDQNAIALIIANWGQETPLGILEAEMGAVKGRMEVLNNRIIRSFLLDPNGYHKDTIEYYKLRHMGHSQRMAYINWLTSERRYGDADAQLTILSNNLPDGEYWSDEYDRFDAFIAQKTQWMQNGKSLSRLDSADRVILETWSDGNDLTGVLAKNLITSNFGEFFYLPPVDLGQGARRASFAGTAVEQLFQAKVYPNPAESYVSFTFTGSMGEDILLSITDGQGRQLKQVNIKAKAPVKTISTKGLSTGQYYYKAVSGEQVISGKLSIVK